jgi:branched-chain amino acid transport system substrate-binding protein
MRRGILSAGVPMLAVLALVGAACSSKSGGGTTPSGGANACTSDKFGCVTIKAGDPIHFGAIQTVSGSTSALGTDEVHGIQLAMDYLDGTFDGKNGTLLGHPVTLTTGDETDPTSGQCGKAGGQTAATKLAADPSIVAVIGTSCSSSALGVSDTILGGKGVVLISASNTSAKLTNPQFHNSFYFRTAQNDAIQAKVVADFVYTKLGIKTAATMNDGGPYTSGLTTGFGTFFKQLGGTITADEAFDPTTKDFKPLLTSIAQGKPGMIYFPDFDPPCALIAIQAKEIPALAGTAKLMGSDGCNEAAFFKTAKTAANGVYLSSPIPSPGAVSALYTQYQAAYKAQYGTPTASFNANAFDAFNLIAQAIKQVAIKGSDGSLQIPRTALKNALYQVKDYQGLTGPLTCISTGDCQSQLAVNIGVYVGPNAPTNAAAKNPQPVFTEKISLNEALGTG